MYKKYSGSKIRFYTFLFLVHFLLDRWSLSESFTNWFESFSQAPTISYWNSREKILCAKIRFTRGLFGKLIFAMFLCTERVCEASTGFKTNQRKSHNSINDENKSFSSLSQRRNGISSILSILVLNVDFSYLRIMRVQVSGFFILQKKGRELCSNICPLNLVHIEIIVDLSATHHRLASCFAQQLLREEIEREKMPEAGAGDIILHLIRFNKICFPLSLFQLFGNVLSLKWLETNINCWFPHLAHLSNAFQLEQGMRENVASEAD